MIGEEYQMDRYGRENRHLRVITHHEGYDAARSSRHFCVPSDTLTRSCAAAAILGAGPKKRKSRSHQESGSFNASSCCP